MKSYTSRRFAPIMACILLIFAATSALDAQHDPPCDSVEFLVALGEMTTDLSPHGVTAGDSLIVMPDGHFQLQRRLQQLPSKTATMKVFDSLLSRDQMQKLQSILEDTKIKELPAYISASLPIEAPWYGMFQAKIARPSGNQKVGFWVWRSSTPTSLSNATPEETRKVWRDSQSALEPLIEWFHQIKTLKLEPSIDAKPMRLCDSEGTEH